eukprot:COSAG02_NODE_8908_length_2403_cov_4.127170_2_plen_103_part_00
MHPNLAPAHVDAMVLEGGHLGLAPDAGGNGSSAFFDAANYAAHTNDCAIRQKAFCLIAPLRASAASDGEEPLQARSAPSGDLGTPSSRLQLSRASLSASPYH